MDKVEAMSKWAWLPKAMPGVARLMVEKRREHGDAHIAECWRRAMAGEAGWFYAAEGPLAIGVPWDDIEINQFSAQRLTAKQALVVVRVPAQKGSA